MPTPYEIIVRPLITEKNTALMQENKYSFEVLRSASKPEIKRAVEYIFNVSVEKVHTMNVRGKLKRRGRETGYQRDWKKAIVTLAPGDTIGIFES
ncbi:50S ribosomal protein L23 [Candidatus Viridilinea mediisalina]|uniref:Large ribosomal subunit protein uL23 n=1 Tax=Candidatus Viridilinea mediisalina TaxID=2024553 RepID=A0A2A6RMD3_9CHLR|nr:50S ribosomal protein L23 [Candidatus Viridilinea mediisalina]PDW04207.1 50S ribosomal protein L23 [Candidatus Viridilinea mediisalina]